jgi:hypothetical protein
MLDLDDALEKYFLPVSRARASVRPSRVCRRRDDDASMAGGVT